MYPNKTCIDYIDNGLLWSFFYYMIYTLVFGNNILGPSVSYIHNRAVTSPIEKSLQCVCLLTLSMLGRHVSTQHFLMFSYFPQEIVFGFCIAITSLEEERASLGAFRMFVRFALVWFCLFPLPLGV